jgi:hypothetical protein
MRDAVGIVVVVMFAVWTVSSIISGEVQTPFNLIKRDDEPEFFYAYIALFIFMFLVGVYVFCVRFRLIPDLLS